jgi:glycosyltransferase involved in cell wall biosynthesis
MKLLVVSHACITPVNQTFYAELTRLTGWKVDLVIPATWKGEYHNQKAVRWPDFTGEIHSVPTWNSGSIPLHVYKAFFTSLLRKVRPDAIYVYHEPYGLATAQMYLANKLVDDVPIGFWGSQTILKKYPIPIRWFEKRVFDRSDFAFFIAQDALDVVRHKGYKAFGEVLPPPLDSSVYSADQVWAAAKREELSIGPHEFVFGYLGRLVEEKGLRNTLIAASGLGDRKWRIVFVGSGAYEPDLRNLAAELGISERVFFIGYVPHEQAPKWLSLFDTLILASETRPNWKEQFGRVIIEANACGTPVIGSDSGEIPNVLRETGGGLIVPEADPIRLGKAMASLADDRRLVTQFADRGKTAVREKYDLTQIVTRFSTSLTAVVADVAGRKRG